MLYQKCIANIIFKQFTKQCFAIWFYNFNLKMCKTPNNFLRKKKTEEKQSSAAIIISVDGKGAVFLVKLKLPWESFE